MKKILGLPIAALASVFTLFLVAPAAQAYPETPVVITVSSHNVSSGQVIRFSASSPVPCKPWTAQFNGQRRTGSGLTFSGSFTAPRVRHTHVFILKISCRTVGNGAGRAMAGHAGNAVMVPMQLITRSVRITVHPAGHTSPTHHTSHNTSGPSTPGLPNTGGPSAALLGGALGLVVVGAGTMLYSRRRLQA